MYQYLLFDLDGTLTDSQEGITKCVQYGLHCIGIEEPDLKRLIPFIGPPLIPSFMEFYHTTQAQAEEAVKYYRERFSTVGLFENKVYEGVPEMLAALKEQGKFLCIASSKPEIYVRRIMDHFDLSGYFGEMVGAEMESGKRCAKHEVIQEAFRRLRLGEEDKKRTLMIGDRKHDIEGAKRCGIDSVGVYTGFAEEGELEKAGAGHVCRGIGELSEYLRKL